jgi:hypothetical protein
MDFITGNKFKEICHYTYDEKGFIIHSEPVDDEVLRVFVKIDYVHNFFTKPPLKPFILFTHNGDAPVDDSYLTYLNNPNLLKWYGQNVMTVHSKLQSIPIGIANNQWDHGNEFDFIEIINENNIKDNLFYINFEITNFSRNDCLDKLYKFGLQKQERKPFKQYLRELSKSYFVISPEGNGIDCHKTWEALYLKSIPIVAKSINAEFYKDYPIIIINDWSEFNPSNYTIERYIEILEDFNINNININNFLKYEK